MGHKEKMADGDELDCVAARKMLKMFERAGVAKRIKRRMIRRMRRVERERLRGGGA